MSKKNKDKKREHYFWISYSDLMTSLFFIMLVLYVISFVLWERAKGKIEVAAKKYKIIENVENNMEPLKKDTLLFKYDEKYHRYQLAFDVYFRSGKYKINKYSLKNYQKTKEKIEETSRKLNLIIGKIEKQKKDSAEKYKNVSYLVVVSGSASNLPRNIADSNYILSFKRAYNLYKFWKDSLGIDFYNKKYDNLIDFQISGNGIGGVGRFPRNPANNYATERKNQRFLINIIPKIGEITRSTN